MKAKPDEIWTNSILHMAGLLVHADTRVRKKKHLIQQRHARGAFRVVNGHVNRGLRLGCLVDGCCCADLNVKAGNGVLATGIAPDHEHRLWSGQLHLGMLTCSLGLRIGFPRFRGLLGIFSICFQSEFDVSFFESCQRRAVFHLEQKDVLYSFGFSAFELRSSAFECAGDPKAECCQ